MINRISAVKGLAAASRPARVLVEPVWLYQGLPQSRRNAGSKSLAQELVAEAANWPVEHLANPRAAPPSAPYPKEASSKMSLAAHNDAIQRISEWPGYSPSPLRQLPDLAAACGVANVYAKDESRRFNCGSFKALGGGLSVEDCVRDEIQKGKRAADVTVATASAGNHGLGVAWSARRVGCRAIVYLGERVSEKQAEKMRAFGAEVRRVEGLYEASMAACIQDSKENGWHVVQDVSWEGYEDVPGRIYSGYSLVASEAIAQVEENSWQPPTHVFVNAGVGGFASGVLSHLWQRLGSSRPRFLCVEPTEAKCCMIGGQTDSLAPGPASTVGTVQTGLDCNEISGMSWEILRTGTNDFVAVPDAAIGPCMRLLANGEAPMAAGESAVAGIAALLAAGAQPALKDGMKLDESSVILAVICEGPPDAETYHKYVGRSVEEVQALM